jgi:hypothetical protein
MPETWVVYEVKDADALTRAICKEWNKVFRRLRNGYWRRRFRQLWEHCATEREFYELANELYLACYGEELSQGNGGQRHGNIGLSCILTLTKRSKSSLTLSSGSIEPCQRHRRSDKIAA